MSEEIALAWVIVVMAAAGIGGGTINQALLPSRGNNSWLEWLKNVGIGLGASFLMPLFLNTISSTLLSNLLSGQGKKVDLLVFGGFCLLAAISSRAFIQSLSERILREAKEARRDAKETRQELRVVEAAVAPLVEQAEEAPQKEDAAAVAAARQQLSEDERRVLRAIHHEQYTLRTVTGIATQASIGERAVRGLLKSLLAKGLVSRVYGKNRRVFWRFTPAGRKLALQPGRGTDPTAPTEPTSG